MNKDVKLTKSQKLELEFILNFYLYEDGIDHESGQIDKVERIKKRFGFAQGDNN
mgnify:CR=1 FL=1